jgi:hypothetical protein
VNKSPPGLQSYEQAFRDNGVDIDILRPRILRCKMIN